jgi:hypothetical protein
VVGEKKKERQGDTWMVGKKKKKGNRKEKRNGEWGLRVWWEKRESGKERRKKKLKGRKLNWFYLYVHFVWCKVWNCEKLFRGCL